MPKGGGNEDRAKVKLRVIEFELEGGNASVENSIRQLTNALTSRTNGAPNRVAPPKAPKEIAGASAEEQEEVETDVQDAEFTDADSTEEAPAKPAKAKTPHKPRVPNYLHDLDLNGPAGGTSLKDFAAKKNPSTNAQRHLVAAYWLKEFGNSPTITIDKVYTCYRTVDWPTNQPDWDVGFRAQVKTNRFRRVSTGEYAINPVGEDDVRKMDGTG